MSADTVVGIDGLQSVSIERVENGFVLRYRDPELEAQNRASDHWVDASKERIYSTAEALLADLRKLIPLMAGEEPDDSPAAVYKNALSEAFGKDNG
jgi:hypothetical protein